MFKDAPHEEFTARATDHPFFACYLLPILEKTLNNCNSNMLYRLYHIAIANLRFENGDYVMYEPRNPEINAQFVEAGGLKSWGCFALLLITLVLIICFVLVHVVLNFIIRDPLAWWISSALLMIAILGIVVLWIRNRQRQKRVLEQIWQQGIENSSGSRNSERDF